MVDHTGMAYNRFTNLDTIEDRIIYYLINPMNKSIAELQQVYTLWKILYYNDTDALFHKLPAYKDIVALIDDGNVNQTNKRIFRSPHLDDSSLEESSLLKIYVDTIIPKERMTATVNMGVDCICHNKIVNLRVPQEFEDLEGVTEEDEEVWTKLFERQKDTWIGISPDGQPIKPQFKSRITAMTKAVLFLLNGAEIAGVGKMSFDPGNNRFNMSQYGRWNNRNFEGIKNVIGVTMSGVS